MSDKGGWYRMSGLSEATVLLERTVPGLHDAVIAAIRSRLHPGLQAVDLGTGSGAFAARLERYGCNVIACDIDPSGYSGQSGLRQVDLDGPNFAAELGRGAFHVVSAIEVIEHLEAPIPFLRQVWSLLDSQGFAVITTPNMDSLPARGKHLLKGKLRMFDDYDDPTHITPIFWDLLVRKYLPRARLRLVAHTLYPPDGFVTGRSLYRDMLALLSPILRGTRLAGDVHVIILAKQ
jgi:SAM-dependent methyltransferase